jgi:Zn-dependent peptidase ImmA (M78 family)
MNISQPYELEIDGIAAGLNIWIHTAELTSRALEREGMGTIILDSRLSREEQWEQFGHELCHLLRHGGNQLEMPDGFIRLQESQADLFALQLCVPAFMLLRLDLPAEEGEAAEAISRSFGVTPSFAARRLAHHARRLQAAVQHAEFVQQTDLEHAALNAAGADYSITNGSSTMLYSREYGVIGYVRRDCHEA